MHRDSLPARRRYTRLAGSADALALARLAQSEKPIVVVTASALDAQRLLEEIHWFSPQLRVCLLPDWETLPYDQFSPHQDLVSERLATLYRIQRGDFDVAVVPASTALVRLCPPAYLAGHTFHLKTADRLSLEGLRQQLATAGYQHVTQVVSPGEVCFRGGLIDLFPMGSALPYRLDLDDDVIDAIKTFDVDTQRTLYSVKEIRMLPAREFPLDDAGRARFRSRWRELFEGDPSKKRLYRDVSNGVPAAGIEYYLPLFFENVATLFDYLPAGSVLALHRDIAEAIQDFWRDANSRYKMAGGDPDRPLLAPAELFVPAEEFYLRAQAFARVDLLDKPEEENRQGLEAIPLPPLAVDRRAQDPLAGLKQFLETSGLRVMRRRRVARTARDHGELLRRIRPQAAAGRELRGIPQVEPALRAAGCSAGARLRPARRGLGGGHRGRALCRRGAPARAHRREAQLGRGHAARPVRAQGRRPRGARAARDRQVSGVAGNELRGREKRIPGSRVRGRRQALRPGLPARRDRPLQRRPARGSAAPQARQRPVGQGQGARREAGARHRGGAARAVCQARGPARPRLWNSSTRPRSIRRRLRLRGDARPGGGDRGGDRRHGGGQADGPPGVRRRRLRQDRGRAARRVRRGRGQQAGGDPLPDHAARRAALPDLLRPLRRLAGQDRRLSASESSKEIERNS